MELEAPVPALRAEAHHGRGQAGRVQRPREIDRLARVLPAAVRRALLCHFLVRKEDYEPRSISIPILQPDGAVMLVDDVVTTAATLNACAAALHDAGVRIISYVTFGRAPAVGDRL